MKKKKKSLPVYGQHIVLKLEDVSNGKPFYDKASTLKQRELLATLKEFTLGGGDGAFQRVPTVGRIDALKALYVVGAFVPPVIVAKVVNGGPEIVVDGGTRLQAAIATGLESLPMLVYTVGSVADAAKLFAIFNNGKMPSQDGLVYSACGRFAEFIRALPVGHSMRGKIGDGTKRRAIGALRVAQIVSNFWRGPLDNNDPDNPLRLSWHKHLANCDQAITKDREKTLAVLDFIGEALAGVPEKGVVHNWTAHAIGILLHGGVPVGKKRDAVIERFREVCEPPEKKRGKIVVNVEERILACLDLGRAYRWTVVPALVKYLQNGKKVGR